MKTLRLGIASVVILGLGVSGTAVADSSDQIETDAVSVSFADLNIHNDAGARVLYARLKQASEQVCEVASYWEAGSVSRLQEAKACYFEAMDDAVAEIDSDALRKIHTS